MLVRRDTRRALRTTPGHFSSTVREVPVRSELATGDAPKENSAVAIGEKRVRLRTRDFCDPADLLLLAAHVNTSRCDSTWRSDSCALTTRVAIEQLPAPTPHSHLPKWALQRLHSGPLPNNRREWLRRRVMGGKLEGENTHVEP